MSEGNRIGNILEKCCGTRPKIKVVTYPGTSYEMFVIVCPKCGMKTQPHRNLNDAYDEWNHPENVHLN